VRNFSLDQLLIAFPSVFIWIGGLCYILFNREGKKYIAIAVIYTGIIGLLLYFNGKGYYAAAIYPTIMAFGGDLVLEGCNKKIFCMVKMGGAGLYVYRYRFFFLCWFRFCRRRNWQLFTKPCISINLPCLKWEDQTTSITTGFFGYAWDGKRWQRKQQKFIIAYLIL
jgi:hypothetical protein